MKNHLKSFCVVHGLELSFPMSSRMVQISMEEVSVLFIAWQVSVVKKTVETSGFKSLGPGSLILQELQTLSWQHPT